MSATEVSPVHVARLSIPVALFVAACGSACSPASPSPASPDVVTAPPAVALPSGRYTLGVSSPSPSSESAWGALCLGHSANSARVPVDITAGSNGWQGRAVTGTLAFALQRSGVHFSGPIWGEGTATDGTVVAFGGSDNSAAELHGRLLVAGQATGTVLGPVVFRYTGYSGSCDPTTFAIAR